MPKPPNILFVFADQMHRYAMGCMGNVDIRTPHLDGLARDGVLFTSAYSNCPVCSPFRVNLFSGMYTSQTDTFHNRARIPERCASLADALNAAGYRTGYVGKWHIGGAGNGPIPEELRAGFQEFIAYQCYNGFRDEVCFYDEGGAEHRFDRHRTDVTTDLAIERLGSMAGAPFALFVSYQAPHYPVQPSPEYEERYKGAPIRRRPNCQDIDPYTRTWSPPSPWPPDACPDFQRYGNDLDEYIRLYYGMCSQIDAGVGRMCDALRRLGLDGDTVVVFTSDHGDMQGSHGLKNKSLPHEESSGIPLIVRVPGGASGVVTDALVSGIDFYPTCLDYAGVAANGDLTGASFAPLTRGDRQGDNRPVFSEMRDWKMVRDGAFKLVVETEGLKPTQLFDLAADPYELANLVDDSEHAARVVALRQRIAEWLEWCEEHSVRDQERAEV